MRSPARRNGWPNASRSTSTAGCDGFVVNLGYASPDLADRVQRFAREIEPLLPR